MSIDTTDCLPWEVYPDARQRRARKPHFCSCCAETIQRGDLYIYEFGVFDGNPDEVKRCLRCQAIYEHLLLRHMNAEDADVDRELKCGHDYTEVFGEEPPPDIARLAFATAAELQAEVKR